MRLDQERITEILVKVYNQKTMWWKAQQDICKIFSISSVTGRNIVRENDKKRNAIGSNEYWRERCEILQEIWNTAPTENVSIEHEEARMKYHEFMVGNDNKHQE